MGFLSKIVRRVKTMFRGFQSAEEVFGVKLIASAEMDNALKLWDQVSRGRPPWTQTADGIKTINMADFVSCTRAKLTTLDIGIAISGPRADFLQSVVDDLLKRLPDKLCDADRMGGMLFKWNGTSWDFVRPDCFGITEKDENGNITGAIFSIQSDQQDGSYTRLEWHRFEHGGSNTDGKVYVVTNKAFKNRTSGQNVTLGDPVPLDSVNEWKGMANEVRIANLKAPLFGYYRVPGSNIIDVSSPLGMSVFGRAMEELKAIDIAISRKNDEVEDSKHITFVGQSCIQYATQNGITLPRFVQGLGVGVDNKDVSAIHEHSPTLLTDDRIKDINFDLSLLGVKCGFSEGVFVLDGQTGMITATQVEADDRDTIQTIKNDRDALQSAIEQALMGADAMATLMGLAPLGEYEAAFSFGDITYSYEEDKANWKSYAQQGWIPKWLYFVKFEKMTEEEAKKFTQEAEQANQAQTKGLFE